MIYRYPRPAVLSEIPSDRHAVLEASAGTGKTYTVEHLVVDRLLGTDATLGQILVVTYTEKATAELKSRIRMLIETILSTAEKRADDSEEQNHKKWWYFNELAYQKLEAELFGFDQAPIYTIHGFCNRLLTELAFNSGQLLKREQVDTDVVFETAWRQAVREEFACVPDLSERLIRSHTSHLGDESLRKLLQRAHTQDYLQNRLDIEDEVSRLRAVLVAEFDGQMFMGDASRLAIQRRGIEALQITIPLLVELLSSPLDTHDFLQALFNLNMKSILAPTGSRPTATKAAFPAGLHPENQAHIGRIKQLWRVCQLTQAKDRADVDALLPSVHRRVQALKEAERQFEYNDLLDRVHRALTGPDNEAFVEILHGRFRYGLIDEFQDTDAKQWAIFHRIFVDNPEGYLYIIGDPKQAIYSFRGADIHTYLVARKNLISEQAPPAVRVPLKVNYRSTQPMIDGINLILSQEGTHPLLQGNIRYDEPVECGKPTLRLVDAQDQNISPITLWRQTINPTGKRGRLSGRAILEGFTGNLLDSLRTLLGDESQGSYLVDEDGEKRRLMARDVFILVRTGKEAAIVGELLEREGIPCVRPASTRLFQTEAGDAVYGLLKAISAPGNPQAQMGAWCTFFFPIPWTAVASMKGAHTDHPYVRRVYRWRALAELGDFGRLFRSINVESGLLARSLDSADGQQTLSQVDQIFECLIEAIGGRHASIEFILARLEEWRRGENIPNAVAKGSRLATETDAVQVMTIHKSKGLQAGIVYLLGGYSSPPTSRIQTVNHEGQRHVLVGKDACNAFGDVLRVQTKEEDERLLYVALTRSVAKLYLPVIESRSAIPGPYRILNSRLMSLIKSELINPFVVTESSYATHTEITAPPLDLATVEANIRQKDRAASRDIYQQLRQQHAPWVVTSYSAMKEQGDKLPDVEFATMNEAIDDLGQPMEIVETVEHTINPLPGGKHMGRFLHEAIEEIEFALVLAHDADTWAQRADVIAAFELTMRRHGIDPKWRASAQEVIHATLSRAIDCGGLLVPSLAAVEGRREMEFIFPMPENEHPSLGTAEHQEGAWSIERGLIKGFIDFVFQFQDKLYWLDWKSDRLENYDNPALEKHVSSHYTVQAMVYTLALVRLLGIQSLAEYEARFGGYLYVFLRGMEHEGPPDRGIYFSRPSWRQVIAWERSLISDPRLPNRVYV